MIIKNWALLLAVSVFFIGFALAPAASAQTSNLVANSSVETASGSAPANWSTDVWGTTKATFTYPTGGAQDGTRYVKTQITTKGTGDAKWYPNHIAGTSGATYTFSDWYQGTVASTVQVEVLLNSGSYTYLELGAPAISSTWKQFSKTFTLPANTKTFTVFHFIKAVGTLSVDNYSLTSGTVTPPPSFDFSLSRGPEVVQGQSTSFLFTATLTSGATQAVTFSAAGMPSGVSAAFTATSCNPTCSSTGTFTASASAAPGTYPITVSATAGSLVKTSTFNLTVVSTTPPPAFDFALANAGNRTIVQGASTSTSITATLLSGTTQAVTMNAGSLPSGITAGFSQNSCSPTCSSTLTFNASASAATGTYPIIVSATAGTSTKTTSFNLTVAASVVVPPPAFNFTLSNSGAKSVAQGSAVGNLITATLTSGTTQPATFSASGLPSGVSASFSQGSCSPTCSSTLTLTASASAALGTSTVTVIATAGSVVKTATFALGVFAPQVVVPPTNLIKNPSVETVNPNNANLPQNWTHEKWGTNTTTFTYVKNGGHSGSNSVKVQISSYTDGDAKWIPAAIPVTPGDSYRLTDWYQSTVENYPVIDFALSDGTDYYLGLRPQDAAAGWTQFSETFQVPAKATSMRVMHLITSVGTLSLDDMSITKITPKGFSRAIVSIDFDDGWEDDTISALPILNNLGFKATWFFATTYLESTPATGPINVSGPTALRTLFNAGMEIGGHTVTHPDLTTLNQSDLNYELNHSKQYLESVVGQGTVTNLATPYGTYSDQVIATAKPLYNSLRSTDEGFNTGDDFDQYRLEVQNMQKTTTLAQFKSWIDQAVKDKSWLVLVYHRVATSSLEDFDTPVADFAPQMNYIKQSGISVQTTQQALNEILPQLGISSGVTAGSGSGGGSMVATSTGTLSIANSATPASQSVLVNTPGQPLGGFTLTAENEAITIPSMSFYLATSSTGSGLLTNITLQDSTGVVYAGPVDATYDAASGKQKITFNDMVTVPVGTKSFVIKGKLPASYTNGGTTIVSTNPASNWGVAKGQTSNTTISLPNTTVSMNTMMVAVGDIKVSVDSSSPAYQVAVGGSTGVTLGTIKLHADGESAMVTQLGLKLTSGTSASINKVVIFNGATQVGSAIFISNSSFATSTLVNPISVNVGADVVLTVKADLAAIGIGQSGVDGALVQVDPSAAKGNGASSGTSLTTAATGNTAGVRTFKSYPVAALGSVSSSGISDGRLMRFSLTSYNAGTVGIGKLSFDLSTTSATVNNVKLLAYTDSGYSNPIGGQGPGGLIGSVIANVPANFSITPSTNPIEIPAGTTYYFELRSDVSNVGSSSSIVTSLIGDAAFDGMKQAANAVGNFVWSPNATTTSTFFANDWTSGFGLPGLPAAGLTQARTQ